MIARPGARGAAPLVYLITDRHATAGRPLDEVVARALRALAGAAWPPGALAVQLREKDLEARALLALARPLRALTAAARVRLFVNDRVDVALAVGADGVHLGGGALGLGDVRAVAPTLEIAVSTHAVPEAIQTAADPRVSFVVFGPIFDTPAKRAFGPPQGLASLRAACAPGGPVVAIGGIAAGQARACREAGASGVACIRAILGAADPERALAAFFEAIETT